MEFQKTTLIFFYLTVNSKPLKYCSHDNLYWYILFYLVLFLQSMYPNLFVFIYMYMHNDDIFWSQYSTVIF